MEDTVLFNPREWASIEKAGTAAAFKAGDFLFRQGETGDTLFFIRSGTVQLSRTLEDLSDELLLVIGAGEIAGDFSSPADALRFSTAQALEAVEAVEIEQSLMLALIGEQPHIARAVVTYLSARSHDSDLFRVAMLQKKNEQILRSYEELKNAQQELMKNERLAAVGNLASKIIHDIKGTITPLKIYSENLDRLPEAARKVGIDTICQSIGRIIRICEELLEYVRGKPVALKKGFCDLRSFIRNETGFVRDIMDRAGITLSVQCSFDGEIYADEERLGRVMQNLLLNAREAMPDGGTIFIEASADEHDILIRITDTGPGIDEEFQEKVFEPFFSHGKKKGTGLGLTISKKIMDEHGGAIYVENAPGKGASFILSVPRPADSPAFLPSEPPVRS